MSLSRDFVNKLTEFVRAGAMEAAANGATLKGDIVLVFDNVSLTFGYGEHDYRLIKFADGEGAVEDLALDEACARFARACDGQNWRDTPQQAEVVQAAPRQIHPAATRRTLPPSRGV